MFQSHHRDIVKEVSSVRLSFKQNRQTGRTNSRHFHWADAEIAGLIAVETKSCMVSGKYSFYLTDSSKLELFLPFEIQLKIMGFLFVYIH